MGGSLDPRTQGGRVREYQGSSGRGELESGAFRFVFIFR
jgi:hypothetical protein